MKLYGASAEQFMHFQPTAQSNSAVFVDGFHWQKMVFSATPSFSTSSRYISYGKILDQAVSKMLMGLYCSELSL